MGNIALKKVLSDAEVINIDRAIPYSVYKLILTANRELTVSNFSDADSFLLMVQQDAIGSHTLEMYGVGLNIGTTANQVTTIGVLRDGKINRLTYSDAAEQAAQEAQDADAAAYVSAAGLTGENEVNAVGELVTNLKVNSLWSKIKGMWLFWDSLNESKFNLVNPVDSDNAFRLVQAGSGTFANGYTNAAASYLNTKVTPDEANASGLFTRVLSVMTDVQESAVDFGRMTVTGDVTTDFVQTRNASNNLFCRNSHVSLATTVANANSMGRYYLISRAAQAQVYKNGALIATTTQTSAVDSNKEFVIGAGGNNSYTYATKKYSLAALMDELTSNEVLALDEVITAFNNALGRS